MGPGSALGRDVIGDAHGPYAQAVMEDLAALADPAASWAEITPDLEIVVTLDRARARAAGWEQGLIICWHQQSGWEWANMLEEGVSAIPRRLLTGVVVADPADVTSAVKVLLAGPEGHRQLPREGTPRPQAGPVTLTPARKAALRGLPRVIAEDLAAYAI
ncbi:hypothetical protein ACIQVO_36950 [Streptomyces sp. NPDC101062]|uniref:hypothetical protein n=1 Tax=unclassified Streptomyces TaxID=2593676 RepID=UPI0038238AB9